MLRGNAKAAKAIDDAEEKALSVVNTMELLQDARNKNEVRAIRSFLSDMRFQTYPLSENIGHRALIYMEEYSLATSLCLADALIAATAVEANSPLLTANDKHYRSIKELKMKRFRP